MTTTCRALLALLLLLPLALPLQAAPVTGTEVVPAFDPAAATADYLARLPEDARERSDAYFEGRIWLQLWGFLYGAAVAVLLLASGLSARMRDLAERLTRSRLRQTAVYAVLYVPLVSLLSYPLTLYQGFFREHQYGLSTQTYGAWMRDQLVGLAVGVVLGTLAIAGLYAVFRRAPRTWWLWGSAAGVLFVAFILLVAPVYIDPLFNEYRSLEDPGLKGEILSLARASGIEADRVLQFDASRQSRRISANVSGLWGTMSIRLNDNLLARCGPSEIRAVMGHEIGHYVLHHVYETLLFLGVVLVGGFGFIRWGFDRVLMRWGGRWGVAGVWDVAGLPLIGLLFSTYLFLMAPLLNTFVRSNEAEADLYGLQAAREPDGFAEVALKLAEYRKLDPGPLEEWLFYDHPSGRARIRMAMDWKAEQLRRRDDPAANAAIAELLAAQAEAWNRGDLAGFCGLYSADALLLTPTGETRGRESICQRYAERYPDAEARGTLTLDVEEIRRLAPDSASVAARWSLAYPDREATRGRTFLLLTRTADGWRVSRDASM